MNDNLTELFGPVIASYTRSQSISDGFQIDVSETAKEAGISFPTFINRTVFDAYVVVPEGVEGQDESGRLWDIINGLRFAIDKTRRSASRIPFDLLVKNKNSKPCLVKLAAMCGPLDINDHKPAITIIMPD